MNHNIEELIKSRYNYNNKIIDRIIEYNEKNKDLRFLQILYNLNILNNNEDKFYEESKITYDRTLSQ